MAKPFSCQTPLRQYSDQCCLVSLLVLLLWLLQDSTVLLKLVLLSSQGGANAKLVFAFSPLSARVALSYAQIKPQGYIPKFKSSCNFCSPCYNPSQAQPMPLFSLLVNNAQIKYLTNSGCIFAQAFTKGVGEISSKKIFISCIISPPNPTSFIAL